MAGFQPSTNGRIWVSTEGGTTRPNEMTALASTSSNPTDRRLSRNLQFYKIDNITGGDVGIGRVVRPSYVSYVQVDAGT